MYDQGSSSNVIVGEIAETENFKILSARAGCSQVAGGHQVPTDYGLYTTVVGPSISGEYIGLTCQGIAKIAGDLEEQSLNEVNRELKRSGLINPDPTPTRVCWRRPSRPVDRNPGHSTGSSAGCSATGGDWSLQVPVHRCMGLEPSLCWSSPIVPNLADKPPHLIADGATPTVP